MLARLNSLAIGSFRQSTDTETSEEQNQLPPELPDGEVPSSDSTLSFEIDNSVDRKSVV